ncbi:MAG: hypothetical protein JZU53_15675 [Paludibacter sp.]|nr:hypothetical protein [Paludibacter sp.]
MKIQVVVTISADGYLLKRENNAKKQINSGKYGFSALQKRADLMLHKESSLIALLEEKRQSSDTDYLAEANPESLDLIKGLFLYRLADELILYMLPDQKENGIRLFDLTSPTDWILAIESSKRNASSCFIYHRIK